MNAGAELKMIVDIPLQSSRRALAVINFFLRKVRSSEGRKGGNWSSSTM